MSSLSFYLVGRCRPPELRHTPRRCVGVQSSGHGIRCRALRGSARRASATHACRSRLCGRPFAGIEKIIGRRGVETSIGFGAQIKDGEEKTLGEIYMQVQPEDLLKYGLIPEFVGRLPVITALEDLSEEALVKVLTEPKNALIKQYETLFGMEDVKLTITNDALVAIAKKAIERKTGARGLRAIMEENLLDLMYDIPDKKDITEIVVDAKVINEGKAPTFIRKRHKKSA